MRRRALAAVAFLAFLPGALAGCGTASAPSPPAGVDELVIPTPSPDPGDFVAGVDNPWFPLPQGRTWTYVVADVSGSHGLTVTVADGPEVDGVATTARVSTEQGRTVTDWYAQDTDGNVWWFGREGVWRAGADGAEAGVAMLATPRVGDGYRTAYAEGVVEDHATVMSLDEDRLVVDVQHPEPVAGSTEITYERGTGPVEESSTSGAYRVVRLRTAISSGA
ncbi:hypothetical protein [Nocardioides mangrovi]|uniref:Uncharacterized protein n=1 Tax=Nocardioides mangrovi TaxID=2874580 RepID=A0ABS7UHC2_9ACTN|nr:hypothetical protein [Nocardioides mangrovi]MBZ5740195.1 hypothetical protein [Nocardioides mangrovi]